MNRIVLLDGSAVDFHFVSTAHTSLFVPLNITEKKPFNRQTKRGNNIYIRLDWYKATATATEHPNVCSNMAMEQYLYPSKNIYGM